MSYEPPFQPDDTRPGPAFNAPPAGLEYGVPFRGDDSVGGGPGCGMYGLIGGVLLLFSLAIVALAAAAGWTSGQREANIILTSTQDAAIAEQ
ncbi:MAG: hypothetical protein NZM00_06370, partial [Anaerolinea sp.]|nr:hypothetical protein [Anaerolinea sp.]